MANISPIEIAALRIAASVPIKPSSQHGTAYVPWQHLVELRKQLEAHGIDWRRIHKMVADEKAQALQKRRDYYEQQEKTNGTRTR